MDCVYEWVVDEDNLNHYLQTNEVVDVLNQLGIHAVFSKYNEGQLLWDGECFHLYCLKGTTNRHPDHLVLIPLSCQDGLSQAIAQAGHLLRKDLGYPGTFVIFRDKKIEIIPRGAPSGDPNACSLKEKLASLGYAMSEKFSTLTANPCISDNSKLIKKLAAHRFSKMTNPDEPETFEPSARQLTGIHHAIHAIARQLFKQFDQLGILLKGFPPSQLDLSKFPHSIKKTIDHCDFCDSQVVANQMVYEGKHFHVLCNYVPWNNPHFMIVSKKHKQYLEMLDNQELEELLRLEKSLRAVLKTQQPSQPVMGVIQNGISGGQTQPHFHLHVLSVPQTLPFTWHIMKDILGMNRKMTVQEMRAVREEFEPLILQQEQL